jgi:hypothetical protein
VQPQSAGALEREVLAASDPFMAMALECFVPDAAETIVKIKAYERFRQWCMDNGRVDMRLTTPDNKFGAKLRAVPGFERIEEWRPHGQPRRWVGVRLKSRSEGT